jgi:1-acyl-sn-glycerol-3-phosphate acyltransferase
MNEVRAVGLASPARAMVKSLYDGAVFYASLLLLALICLSWSLLALPLYPLLPHKLGARVGRIGITLAFRIYSRWLSASGAYRLDLSALDSIPRGEPIILAPNHPSQIDAILILSRHPNLVCVMKSDLMGNLLFGPGARLARYVRNDSPRQMVREAITNLRDGGTLLLFPEGTRSRRSPIGAIKKSVGLIAKHAQLPVQTLIIETDSPFLSKGWPIWNRPVLPITYRVRLGRRFESPQDAERFGVELERYFRSELQGGLTAQWLGDASCH